MTARAPLYEYGANIDLVEYPKMISGDRIRNPYYQM